VKLWDAASGRELRTLIGHSDYVESALFSADGRTILSGSKDTTIRRWSLAGELLATSVAALNGEWITITPEGFLMPLRTAPHHSARCAGLKFSPSISSINPSIVPTSCARSLPAIRAAW
jgi:WD40 repeat protein